MKNLFLLLLFFPFVLFSQNRTADIKGKVTDRFNQPIDNVSITFLNKGTTTNKNGDYSLVIPIRKTVIVSFAHVAYKTIIKKITLRGNRIVNFSPSLYAKTKKLDEVIVKNYNKKAQGITKINPNKIKRLPGANAGVENLLMTFAGVNNNNELSTQYNVRGGNFDENLVYVNGIEVYRPFLIRSGQQEGLSFINSDMIQNINFSAGGFQAKYGDKLSSVLDITYRTPTKFKTTINASLIGASATLENQLLNKKLSAILSVRYRNNSLFVNSKQIETNFKPNFTDAQSFLSYKANDQLKISFLGNFSLNNYNYQPISRKTRFGRISEPLELIVFYNGQEKDKYLTLLGAFSVDYKVTKKLNITGIVSSYNTQEEEHFDIAASYNLGEVDTNIGSETFGDVKFSQGIGSQINHARNDLDALINNIQLKVNLKDGENEWKAGIKYQTENIKDRIREWEIIDSLGFSVRPLHHTGNNQPYTPFTGPIEPYQSIRAFNNVTINRISGFAQVSRKTTINEHQFWVNFGVSGQYWKVNSERHFIFSPRAQLAIKPNWEKDMLFRVSGGWYSQAPFYKELRDNHGKLHPEVLAQKSIHLVAGNDYSFTMWNRPFKLITEIYYKDLSNINSYTVDNVRIRYAANNKSKGYATGLDIRLNGEFVPGNDSWVSIGYLKSEENIDNRGYIARPSDQRLKVGVLFQDYVPNLPDLKAYLNLVYNTGVPGGSPSYADVYKFQNRLNGYKRADIGISYVLKDVNKKQTVNWLRGFTEFTAGLELFNMFDIQNSITNTWVRDVYSKRQYGIPNFMTGRVLNFKIGIQF